MKLSPTMEMGKALVDLAVTLAGYHKELVAQGFTRQEALAIIINHQSSLFLAPVTTTSSGKDS
jgi:hypothetical protein